MADYTPEQLRRLWRIEMEIYCAIAGICENHGLRYYAGCGTTLGAVRHQGFIPWDDDMDVCMPRKDYEEFLKIAPRELPEKMEILGIGFTKGYVMPFIKIHNRRTTLVEETDQNRKYHTGIYVDVFPLDAAAPTEELKKKHFMRCWRWARACVLAEYGRAKLPEGMNPVLRIPVQAACLGIHGLLCLTGRKPESFYAKFVRDARRYEREGEPAEYVQMCDKAFPPEYNRAETLFPTRTVQFENIQIRIPGDPDAYLKELYGNYMQLPPPEKRHNHYPAVLDFADEGESGT